MKLDVDVLRYLSKEDFRVLTTVELGMRNHEIVPSELIDRIAVSSFQKCGDKWKKKWKLWRSASEGFGFRSSMNKGHHYKGCSSFVLDDEAFNFAVGTVPRARAPHKDFVVIKQE